MSGSRRLRVLRVRADVPASIHLNLTDRCASRCRRCELAGGGGTSREMPLALVERLLALARDVGCPVMLSGGEPLLHAQIERILTTAARDDVPLWIMTGGHEFLRLMRTGEDIPLNRNATVLLSLDAADPDRNDSRRGRAGSHAAVLAGVRLARERCAVALVAVAEPNLANVPGLIELAAREGVPLLVQPCIYLSNFPGREAVAAKRTTQAELAELADDIARRLSACRRIARRLRLPTNLDALRFWLPAYYGGARPTSAFPSGVLPRFTCAVPRRQFTVDVDGACQPCVFLPGRARLTAQDDLLAAWRDAVAPFRAQPFERWVTPACRSCACHLPANYRDSLLAYPWPNRRAFLAYARYVARRRFDAWAQRKSPD